MFLGEKPDDLIYYVCLKENFVLEEELSHSVAWVSTTILLIWSVPKFVSHIQAYVEKCIDYK